MEINELFGVPAHPLIVHAAVVFVPLAALGALAMGVSGRVRDRLGWIVVGLAVIAVGTVGLAQKSGEALADHVQPNALVDRHVEMGEAVLPWALGILLVTAAIMVLHTWGPRLLASSGAGATPPDAAPSWLRPGLLALGALAVVFALGASVQVYRVGHSGAAATWQTTDMNGPSTGGGERGG